MSETSDAALQSPVAYDASRRSREEKIDLMVRVLIWATIAAVVAIAFAVGLFIARELLGALANFALPLAIGAVVWAGWAHHRVRRLERRLQHLPR